MKSYVVQVVVGNVYEITVQGNSIEKAQELALEFAYDGELIEAGRAVYAIEETEEQPQELKLNLKLARSLLEASRLALAKEDTEGTRKRLEMLGDVLRHMNAIEGGN
jgi:hypothetical protein